MIFTKREVFGRGFKLGSFLALLFIGSCELSSKSGEATKVQEIGEAKPGMAQTLKSQVTRDQVDGAVRLLRKKGFLSRKEFVSVCGFGDDSGKVSVGSPYEGRVGINESWAIEDGATVKASGHSAHVGEMSPDLIDRVRSGKILDDFKIFDIWIFDRSGKLVESATASGSGRR
jgi:hypothetical protein